MRTGLQNESVFEISGSTDSGIDVWESKEDDQIVKTERKERL